MIWPVFWFGLAAIGLVLFLSSVSALFAERPKRPKRPADEEMERFRAACADLEWALGSELLPVLERIADELARIRR